MKNASFRATPSTLPPPLTPSPPSLALGPITVGSVAVELGWTHAELFGRADLHQSSSATCVGTDRQHRPSDGRAAAAEASSRRTEGLGRGRNGTERRLVGIRIVVDWDTRDCSSNGSHPASRCDGHSSYDLLRLLNDTPSGCLYG